MSDELTKEQVNELRAEYGIECPQCPLAREKGTICKSDYHERNGVLLLPMRYPIGKP